MCGEYVYRMTLAGIWTEAVLFGIYVMLFAGSIYVLVWKQPNRFYLIITILLFALTTMCTVADITLVLLTPDVTSSSVWQNGAHLPCSLSGSATRVHEAMVGNILALLQDAFSALLCFVADALLIYRCFMLWSRNKWAIVLPSGLLLSTTASNIAGMYYIGVLITLQKNGSLSSQLENMLDNHYTTVASIANWLSLATNIITTFLLTLRIWWMTRDIRGYSSSSAVRYYSIIAMMVESGSLYCASLLVLSILESLASIDYTIATTMNQQLLAIAPTLIIVRVGMGKGFEQVQDSLHASHMINNHASASSPRHHIGTMSGIHFQTVHAAESLVSKVEHDGDNSQGVSIITQNTGATGDVGAMA